MIFYNSMKNLLRARGKTALFFALILILTLLLGLDACVWTSVTGYLNACDLNYTTIGLFEYMGADYPDERIYDAGVAETMESFDFSQLADNDSVLLWEAAGRALGYTEGYTRTDSGMYDKNRAVLVVGLPYLADNGLYRSLVTETLYSYQDHTGDLIFVDTDGLTELAAGHYYLISGTYYDGTTSYTYLGLAPLESAAVAAAGAADPVYLDITDPDADVGYTLPKDSVFWDIAETERILNNSLDVFATGDIDAQVSFQQNESYITDGRAFTAEEYASGAKVCIVSEALCKKLGLGVGDTLPISLASSGDAPVYESYWAEAGFASTADYTIVGVMSTPKTMEQYVYVPKGADPVFDQNVIGYTIGTALLKNGEADSFYSEMEQVLPDRVRLTIYDQGYAAAAEP